jgi:hypothetical protein
VIRKQSKAALKQAVSDVVQGSGRVQWLYGVKDPRMEGVELHFWQTVCVCWLGDGLGCMGASVQAE